MTVSVLLTVVLAALATFFVLLCQSLWRPFLCCFSGGIGDGFCIVGHTALAIVSVVVPTTLATVFVLFFQRLL